MTDTILSARYHGQALIEALHDAVEAQDHGAARDIVRAAYRAGLDASPVVPLHLGDIRYPHAIGGRDE